MSRSTGIVLAFLLGVASASAFAETPAAIPSASWPFIEVNPGSITAFRERGGHRPFVAVGVNYFDPETGWAPKLWQQYDESRVRRHLQLIHDQGFNTIRVFLTLQSFHTEPGTVDAAGLEKFRRFLTLCQQGPTTGKVCRHGVSPILTPMRRISRPTRRGGEPLPAPCGTRRRSWPTTS
jgi:hypothetical protein